jgi:hypothetical protein
MDGGTSRCPESFEGPPPYSKNHPADSFPGFFSGPLVGAGEELFVAPSLGALVFSPPVCVAGDSFLAASLYESLR